MKISIDWIKDFVELPTDLTPKEIGSRFTLATAEVEDVVSVGEHLEKIRIVQIVSIEKHPEADKLNLVTFNTSKEEKRVVCGAGNVKVGIKVPYAPLGTAFPDGLVLEPKKIRGILSEGMLCSEQELGFAEDSHGLLVFPEDAPLGVNMLEYFKMTRDVLLDVDNKSLTHRPDLWGHFGMAREFSAIFEKPLKNRFDATWTKNLEAKFSSEQAPVGVRIAGDSSCLGYYGLTVKNVSVKESPDWMKRRLLAVGLRPINNIVDISNYVMLELGIPLHIFDREEIAGDEVIIKRVGSDVTFKTLDEQDRKLLAHDTVICDKNEALVIAGIMGGLKSGVKESTKNIFIEVANWKAAEVRKTSTRLGLRTDSSQRYEKSLDTAMLYRTLLRTLELVLDFCPEAKVVGKPQYDGEQWSMKEPLVISTSVDRICKVLGKEVTEEKILSIFVHLDFKVEKKGAELVVTVPSYRATKDVEYQADLFEEIGRMVGFDNITPQSPKVDIFPVRLTEAQKLHRKIRDFMVNHVRSFEVMTYPLVGEDLYKQASWVEKDPLVIVNALSEEHNRMRQSLIPSLLEKVSLNQKYNDEFRLFELGRVYLKGPNKEFSKDHSQLIIAFFDREKSPFMDMVNTVESLMDAIQIPGDLSEKNSKFKNPLVMNEDWMGCHPVEFLNVRIMGKMKGVLTSIHPLLLKKLKVRGHVTLAVLDFTDIEDQPVKDKVKYKPLAKFQDSTFDWTVVMPKAGTVADLLSVVKKVNIKEMSSCKILDTYAMSETHTSITLRATFIDPEKNLSGEFLDKAKKDLVEALTKAGFPLRA